MVSTRRSAKLRQNASSGDNGTDYHPELEEGGSGPLTARGLRFESRSSRRALTQKGKQPERCRITGRLSKLPGMPLDVLYEVRRSQFCHRRRRDDDMFDVYRYSLSSTRWIYCGCRGPARPFVTFSPASPRGRFG